jgi:hypothetical protein
MNLAFIYPEPSGQPQPSAQSQTAAQD